MEAREEENPGDLRARREAERAHNAAVRARWARRKTATNYNQQMENKMDKLEAMDDARWTASQAVIAEREKAELEAGLMAYYEGRKAGEAVVTSPHLLACTADNPYGLPVYDKNQKALDWLVGLYKSENLPGGTLIERTKYILDATQNGYHVHFNDRIAPGDSGFNLAFQDSGKWPNSGNQVGHYLTAVDLSLWANNRGNPIERNLFRSLAIDLVIGHELIGDYQESFSNSPAINQMIGLGVNLLQYGAGAFANIYTNGKSREWFLSGENANFKQLLLIGPNFNIFRNGNSIQDFRLTYQGWTDAEKMLNGDFETNEEFADAIQSNLGNSNIP